MKNYYCILGLAANGLNATGNKYSLDEIKTAYKKLVKKYHPDINRETRSKFEEIQKAYEIFEDPEKRKDFDEELSKAPGGVYDDESLIVTLDEEVRIRLDQNDGIHLNDCKVLTLAPPKGTDITLLIENAEYSGEQILEIAKKKISFAKAIVDNARSFAYLSGAQQFELIFIICLGLSELDVKAFLAKDNIKLLLNKLTSHQEKIEGDFLAACIKQKDMAIKVFSYISEYIQKFSKNLLYVLGQNFPELIDVFMQKHASNLRISEIISLLDKNNDNQQKIVDAYMQTASETQREKLKNYFDMISLLSVCKDWDKVFNTLKNHIKIIEQLGVDALLLVNYCEKKFKQDKNNNKNEGISEGDDADEGIVDDYYKIFIRYFILNIIFRSPLINDFSNLQKNEKNELCNEIISALIVLQQSGQIKDDNNDLIDFLLKNISDNLFDQFIKNIKLSAFSEGLIKKITLYILNYSSSKGIDGLEFWSMLNKPQSPAWKCMLQNKTLLLAMFEHHLFMTLSDDVKKRMMYACSYFQLTEDQIPFAKLCLPCLDIFKAYNEFFIYINRKDPTKTGFDGILSDVLPAISQEPIDFETFIRLFEITGYFEELSGLKMNFDVRICFELLRGSLAKQSQKNDIDTSKKYQYKNWIESILSSGDLKIIGEMLNVIEDDYSDLVNKAFKNISEISYDFNDILLCCVNLYVHKNWFLRNICGATLYALMQAVCSYEGVKKIVCSTCLDFKYNDRCILKISELSEELKDNPNQYRQVFTKFANNLKKQDLEEKMLQSRLINIIALVESEEIIKKADSYGKLLQKLHYIKTAAVNDVNNDKILQELLSLLEIACLDKQTFKLLRASIGKHFYLWSALLLMMRESKTLVIFHNVAKKLNDKQKTDEDNNHRQAKPLELMFLTVARHYLSKYRGNIGGDKLVEMMKIFGNDIVDDIKLYGLEDKFIQACKLDRIFSNIQQKAANFENQKFNAEQVAETLLLEFELLINNTPLNELTVQPNAEKYFNDLRPFISRLDKERLSLIHKSYPKEDRQNLLLWIFNCAFAYEHFSKNKLMDWINHQDSFLIISKSLIQYITDLISKDKITVNALRDLLGQLALTKLITVMLLGENVDNPLIKRVLKEIDYEELTSDEIKQRFGDINRDRLLTIFFQTIDILKKHRLFVSMIQATLAGDEFCKANLIKWCEEKDRAAELIYIIFETTTKYIQRQQTIILEEIKNCFGDYIFYKVVNTAFSQGDYHLQPLVAKILVSIDRQNFNFVEIDQLCGDYNRKLILDVYLQKYSINNKHKLMHSFIEHAFKQDDYSNKRINAWLHDPLLESYVISSIANYLSEASCSIDISMVKNIPFKTAIPKIISLILKQENPFNNRIIKQIIYEIELNDLTIEEIEKRNGIDNRNQLLEGYFKSYSIIGKHRLLSSLITKAFVNDNFPVNKLTELCSTDDSFESIIATIVAVMSNELSQGKNILDLIGFFNLTIKQKILTYIFDQNNELSNIILGKIIAQIDYYNMSFADIESYYGKTNINKILHHHFKAKNSFFTWPIVQEEINRNSICQCILQGHLPLAQIFYLEKSQLDRLGNNVIVKFLDSKPLNLKLFLLKLLDARQDKYLLMPLLHEGLIDNEFDEIDYGTTAYEAYLFLMEQADWNNKAQIKLQLQQLNKLLTKSIYMQIDKYIIELFNAEIKRLKADNGSSFKESGEEKARQLEVAKNEIKEIVRQDIMHHVKNNISQNVALPFNHARDLAENVKNKMLEISRRDIIGNSRNKVAAFSKGICGVLLSLPLFCTPLFVEKYRDFFFKSDTASSLKYFSGTTRDNGSQHNLNFHNRK